MEGTRKYPLYIKYEKRVYMVLGEITSDDQPFKNGKGYIHDGYIWIFSNKRPDDSKVPYFWYEHGKICFGKMREPLKEYFSEDKLLDLSFANTVYQMDPNEELYDENVLSDMNSSTSIFIPEINEGDDCLKILIKMAIKEKKINVNRLKSRMDKSYSLSNLKTALIGKTKMSVPNFIVWCDLLGLGFNITIFDNQMDEQNPLKHAIEYDSMKDSYTHI